MESAMSAYEFDYSIRPYRYAKGKVAVTCPSRDGFKSRAARLAGTFGRWTHRAGGYVMSAKAAERFEECYRLGWDAGVLSGKREAP
jgi:hypothetical protein